MEKRWISRCQGAEGDPSVPRHVQLFQDQQQRAVEREKLQQEKVEAQALVNRPLSGYFHAPRSYLAAILGEKYGIFLQKLGVLQASRDGTPLEFHA